MHTYHTSTSVTHPHKRGARPPLIITRFPPKALFRVYAPHPRLPFFKRWGSSTHFPTVSPCFHSLNIMPVPPPTYNPPGAWCVCNVKRTTPKAPTSLLKAGFRGKGSPEKGEDTTPTYGWDDNVCWVFVWGVSVWNQKCGETCNLHVITRITR